MTQEPTYDELKVERDALAKEVRSWRVLVYQDASVPFDGKITLGERKS